MKIQYWSDLHLEFPINKKYLKANPIKPKGEILLLGGDIIPFTEIEKENDFFNFLSDSFEYTYWNPEQSTKLKVKEYAVDYPN